MRIESLYLKNFRNVEDQTLHFSPHFTVLIGINGRGKSTWLHGLRVACGAYFQGVTSVKRRHIIDSEIRRIANGILLPQLPVIVEATGWVAGSSTESITWRRQIPEGKRGNTYATRDVGPIRDIAREKYNRMMATGADDLDLPIIAFFGTARVHGAARNRSNPRLGREIFREGYENWFDLRAPIFKYDTWLHTYDALVETGAESPESKAAFFDALKIANPYIQKINFVSAELWLQVQMDDYTSEYLPIQYHSDGVKSFTEMTAELAYRCIVLNGYKRENAIKDTPGVVLIDELDLHLHPNWQRHVVADLKRAFPNIQFVATTHSPFIVQSLEADELINLDNNIETAPNDLSIDEVSTLFMGVKSEFAEKNADLEQKSTSIIQRLQANEPIDEQEINEISNPAVRAFLELTKMAHGQ